MNKSSDYDRNQYIKSIVRVRKNLHNIIDDLNRIMRLYPDNSDTNKLIRDYLIVNVKGLCDSENLIGSIEYILNHISEQI